MYYLDVMRLELVYNGRKSCFPLLQKCLHFFYFVPLCNVIKANFIVLHDSGVNSFCTYCCWPLFTNTFICSAVFSCVLQWYVICTFLITSLQWYLPSHVANSGMANTDSVTCVLVMVHKTRHKQKQNRNFMLSCMILSREQCIPFMVSSSVFIVAVSYCLWRGFQFAF